MKKWISGEESVLQHFVTMLWHFSQHEGKAKVRFYFKCCLEFTSLFVVLKYFILFRLFLLMRN